MHACTWRSVRYVTDGGGVGGAQGHDVEDAGLLLYTNIIGGPAEHLPLLT
jgi:hypothetical protein